MEEEITTEKFRKIRKATLDINRTEADIIWSTIRFLGELEKITRRVDTDNFGEEKWELFCGAEDKMKVLREKLKKNDCAR